MPSSPKTYRPPHVERAAEQSRRDSQQRTDAKRLSYRERGYATHWDKFKLWLKQQPEMIWCDGFDGQCEQATHAFDHIIAMSGPGDEKLTDVRYIAPLCKQCHNRKTIRFDRGFGRKPDDSEAGKRIIQAMLERAKQRAVTIDARGML